MGQSKRNLSRLSSLQEVRQISVLYASMEASGALKSKARGMHNDFNDNWAILGLLVYTAKCSRQGARAYIFGNWPCCVFRV